MSNKAPQKSFFEPKTVIAFALTFLVFVLWQNHMKKKYPHVYAKKAKQEASVNETPKSLPENKINAEDLNDKKEELSSGPVGTSVTPIKDLKNQPEEQKFIIDNEKWKVSVSNYGLAIKDLQIKEYKQRNLKNVNFKEIFATSLLNETESLIFSVEQKENVIIGKYQSDKGEIIKTMSFGKTPYTVDVDYEFKGSFKGISTFISLPINENIKKSMLMPTFERQEYVVIHTDGEDRDMVQTDDFANRLFNQVKMISLGSQFFARSIVDNSTLKPNALVYVDKINKKAIARLDYSFTPDLKTFKISQKLFAGPKDDELLAQVDPSLPSLINFGFFKVLCYPMLKVLKFFNSIFGNYGIAIILLTLLMRILVFPIARRGYKSMNEMQKIQPKLKEIREKYKDEPQKANAETMAVMKENKVNPVGGCLPMLLQLPIFFAFYRVLSESIVMYQAPFALWIQDLSLKDPYYILPVLMGVTMFFQQKLTPTAMDPMQKRVLMLMPVVFSFFMISLPSALTLYIFVSTLFGVLQQYLFTKAK